jgi:hypothetical protein
MMPVMRAGSVCKIGMTDTAPRQKKPRTYSKHGLNQLKQVVKQLGGRAIDKRTATGRELAKWRNDLIDDLGGRDAISTQQAAPVEFAVRSKLLLDSVDAWLLTQDSLINKRKRTLLPVVLQRQQLADGLARYLNQLGMERRHKVKTLSDILAEDDQPATHTNGKALTDPDRSKPCTL